MVLRTDRLTGDQVTCHRRRERTGATLVDLVITILIMGILAATAMPRFASVVARLRTEAVARRVVSDLNFARRSAIQSSRTVVITFAASPAGYSMNGVTHPAFPAQSYAVSLADVDSTVQLQTFSFNSGPVLTFNAYGRPLVGTNPLTTGSVVLKNGSHTFTVVVDPATGESSIP